MSRFHVLLAGLTAATLAAAPGDRARGAEEREGRPPAITIVASPTILPAGTPCSVELAPEEEGGGTSTLTTTYEGTVAEATDAGMTLAVTSERRTSQNKSRWASVPLLNRLLFRNIGIGVPAAGEERKVWVPAESIRSVEVRPRPAPTPEVKGAG